MKETFKQRLKRRMKEWKQQEPKYTDAHWKREHYYLDSSKEEVEWKIVKLEGGGFIRRPFPIKDNEENK